MNIFLAAVIFALMGYLSGSLPFAVWITRFFKKVDVRDFGSRHATTTNTIRTAGFGPGVLVLILDIGKGFLPTWLALLYSPAAWVVGLTAAMAVIGHCWPLFARFRGGMGNACAGGCILAVNPLAFLIGLGILVALTLILRHSARASLITGLAMAPLFWLLEFGDAAIWVAVGGGLVLAYRFIIDWNREYRELWLDRQDASKG
jgi:glycerol-3-phosphate acyltransferase PlsY